MDVESLSDRFQLCKECLFYRIIALDGLLEFLSMLPTTSNGSASDESTQATSARASQVADQYLYFPWGLIRGALTNFGVACAVSAEVSMCMLSPT